MSLVDIPTHEGAENIRRRCCNFVEEEKEEESFSGFHFDGHLSDPRY